MARFVLVHGAFGGAWQWQPVIELLERMGHRTTTFDLPGSGDDPTPAAQVTLDAYVERVLAGLAEDDEPALLTAHSMGGVPVTQAAARAPERIAALIYVTAFLPQHGEGLSDLVRLPEAAGDKVQENMVVAGEPPVATLSPEAAIEAFLGRCDPATARWAAERFTPQPAAPMATPVDVKGSDGFAALTRYYVVCTQDQAVRPPLQRLMLARAGIAEVAELDADHSPYFSATRGLAEALDRFAQLTARVAG